MRKPRVFIYLYGMKPERWTYGLAVAGIATALFVLTMMPTVGLIDSGELALACAEPGIAHPTGYPLYTILGRVFCILTGAEPVFATNFMSAIAGGAAVFGIFLIAILLVDRSNPKASEYFKILMASSIALIFGLSGTMWEISTETEVYALEMAVDFFALFFLLRWWFGGGTRNLLGAAYLFGLAFGVHMLTVLFAPAVLFVMFDSRKRLNLKIFLAATMLFVIGLSVYFYLPIRAGMAPYANFGDPSSWGRFWRHVSGWQYRVWMFGRSGSELVSAVKELFSTLFRDTLGIGLMLGVFGLVFGFIRNRKIAVMLALLALSTILYSLNYSIPDIAPYYLPALASMLLGMACVRLKSRKIGFAMAFLALVSSIAVGAVNYTKSDRSEYYLVEETAGNILALAPRNSVVYLNNWDWYAPAKYLQRARGLRSDVFLLDYELMRRSWYLEGILAREPRAELAGGAIRDFIASVKVFETGREIDPALLEGKWRTMHAEIALSNIRAGNPVLGTAYIGEFVDVWKGAPQRPFGMLMEISDDMVPLRTIPPELYEINEFRSMQGKMTPREITLTGIYQIVWSRMAEYLYSKGLFDDAVSYLELLESVYPNNFRYPQNIGIIRIEQERYEEAMSIFKRIEHILPPGSQPEFIYADLEKRIARRDSLHMRIKNDN